MNDLKNEIWGPHFNFVAMDRPRRGTRPCLGLLGKGHLSPSLSRRLSLSLSFFLSFFLLSLNCVFFFFAYQVNGTAKQAGIGAVILEPEHDASRFS